MFWRKKKAAPPASEWKPRKHKPQPAPYPNLTAEESAVIREFERGRRLREVTQLPGWQDVLDIMEERVVQAEYNLMNYNGVDKEELAALHRRARAYNELFLRTQQEIAAAIEVSRQIPERAVTPVGVPGSTY